MMDSRRPWEVPLGGMETFDPFAEYSETTLASLYAPGCDDSIGINSNCGC